MPTAILIAVASFTVILTASWWLLGSTVPGILVFMVGVAVCCGVGSEGGAALSSESARSHKNKTPGMAGKRAPGA
jgi:hypothetical protein